MGSSLNAEGGETRKFIDCKHLSQRKVNMKEPESELMYECSTSMCDPMPP